MSKPAPTIMRPARPAPKSLGLLGYLHACNFLRACKLAIIARLRRGVIR